MSMSSRIFAISTAFVGISLHPTLPTKTESQNINTKPSTTAPETWLYLASLISNRTWQLIPLPAGKLPISTKWVFKTKIAADGKSEKLKARSVARGFQQRPGINFEETFSPTVKWVTIQIISPWHPPRLGRSSTSTSNRPTSMDPYKRRFIWYNPTA